MATNYLYVPATVLSRKYTVIVDVIVTGLIGFKVRKHIGLVLMRLGAWIMCVNFQIDYKR